MVLLSVFGQFDLINTFFNFLHLGYPSELELRLDFLEHCFHDGGVLNTILDDGKLVNHSRCPTMGKVNNMEEHLSSFSLRALEVGEELTEDYGTYEYPGWLLAICKEFGEDLSYFDLPAEIDAALQE